MKIKICKTLKQNCIKGTNNLIPIILLLIVLCGQSYAQWEKTNFPDTVNVNTIVTKDSSVFVGTEGDGIFVSTNNGGSWKSMNEGLQSKLVHSILITGKTMPAGKARIFAGTETGVSISTDNGENWRTINSGLSGMGVWSLAVSADTSGDTTIYAGCWSGVYSSTNRGGNWEATGLSSTTEPVNSILIYENLIFAATFSDGIFQSYDNGLIWKNIDVKTRASFDYDLIPKSAPIYSISLFSGVNANCIIVGSVGGLYFSGLGDTIFYDDTSFAKVAIQNTPVLCFASRSDTLFTVLDGNFYKFFWGYIYLRGYYGNILDSIPAYDVHRSKIPYLGNHTVYSLALNNEYIFAGTEEGIWRLRYPEPGVITGVERSREVPAGFMLEQNYPNPFNPSTVVAYRLPVGSDVLLKVYDVLGRPVATLVNERQSEGSHSVKFDAVGLPSGVYFYRLQAGSFVGTKKMILLQ